MKDMSGLRQRGRRIWRDGRLLLLVFFDRDRHSLSFVHLTKEVEIWAAVVRMPFSPFSFDTVSHGVDGIYALPPAALTCAALLTTKP